MRCKICSIIEADKKGSHMVPHFLLKRIDNLDGSKDRDKELGFVLSEYNPISYFGKAVLPEKLEEIYGEVTDELIEQNHIPLIEDYIFCTECEKKLSVIESVYANTLKNLSVPGSTYESGISAFLAFIFWCSVIWRLSISKNSGFKLDSNDEKRLNRILANYLNGDVKKITPKLNDPELGKIGYKILRAPKYSDSNSTLLFCHPYLKRPYYFFIDEFIIAFYFRENYVNKSHEKILRIPQILQRSIFNSIQNEEIILSISNIVIDSVKEYFYEELSKRFLGNFSHHLDLIHNKLGGKGQMEQNIKEEIIQKIIHDENVSMGEKYSVRHKAEAIFHVLNKDVS